MLVHESTSVVSCINVMCIALFNYYKCPLISKSYSIILTIYDVFHYNPSIHYTALPYPHFTGEDTVLSDQPYRYLTVDEMKSLGDDSLPIDVTRDERVDSNRMTQSVESTGGQISEELLISPHRVQVHTVMPTKTHVDGLTYVADNIEKVHVG